MTTPTPPIRQYPSLAEVFAKAEGQDIALIQDNDIFYLVLNRPDNTFDLAIIEKINGFLD